MWFKFCTSSKFLRMIAKKNAFKALLSKKSVKVVLILIECQYNNP